MPKHARVHPTSLLSHSPPRSARPAARPRRSTRTTPITPTGRREARQRALPELLRARATGQIRPRRGAPAFLRLRAGRGGLQPGRGTADPECAMAQWGIAMANYHMIWGPLHRGGGRARPRPRAREGRRDVVERGQGSGIGSRAIGAFYIAGAAAPHPERVPAFESAMAGVAAPLPRGSRDRHLPRAGAARRRLQLAAGQDLRQAEAGGRDPQPHPAARARASRRGALHDPLFRLSRSWRRWRSSAARVYAKIAPDSPHALHMPSHIFTRLGLWRSRSTPTWPRPSGAQQLVAKTQARGHRFRRAPRHGLPRVRLSADGARRQAKEVVEVVAQVKSIDNAQFLGRLRARRGSGALRPRAARLEGRRGARTGARHFPGPRCPTPRRTFISPARWGRPAAAISRPRAPRYARLADDPDGARGAQKGFDWATQVEIQRLAAAGLAGPGGGEGRRSAERCCARRPISRTRPTSTRSRRARFCRRASSSPISAERASPRRRSPNTGVAPDRAGALPHACRGGQGGGEGGRPRRGARAGRATGGSSAGAHRRLEPGARAGRAAL